MHGIWDGLYERNQRMLENPSLYTVANWILVGIPDILSDAIDPKKPFSFAHMMSLLDTVSLTHGAAKLALLCVAKETALENIQRKRRPGGLIEIPLCGLVTGGKRFCSGEFLRSSFLLRYSNREVAQKRSCQVVCLT